MRGLAVCLLLTLALCATCTATANTQDALERQARAYKMLMKSIEVEATGPDAAMFPIFPTQRPDIPPNSRWYDDGRCKNEHLQAPCTWAGGGLNCLPYYFYCDNIPDCLYGDDEKGCPGWCHSDTIQCPGEDRCLPRSFRCDGKFHCRDGSDEGNCHYKTLKSWQGEEATGPDAAMFPFLPTQRPDIPPSSRWYDDGKCEHVHLQAKCTLAGGALGCLPFHFYCDNIPDCLYGEDEKGCPGWCHSDTIQCPGEDRCLPRSFRCDGKYHCRDGSDERNC